MVFHWTNWDDVCHPKHEGGLGIRHLQEMNELNEALKAKWLWRFAKAEEALWRKVIEMKYRLIEMKYGLTTLGAGVRSVLVLIGLAVGNQL